MSATPRHCAVLALVGEIDIDTQGGFRAEADALLLDDEVTELVLDCSRTTLLDVGGIGLLMHLSLLTSENAIRLVLRAVPECVRAVLTVTQLDRVLHIDDGATRSRSDA